MDEPEVFLDVIGMQMLQKLVTEDQVRGGIRKIQIVAIIHHKLEIWRRLGRSAGLVGNVNADNAVDVAADFVCQCAIAGREFDEGLHPLKFALQQRHSRGDSLFYGFRAVAAQFSRMIWHAGEQFVIERAKQRGAFSARRIEQALRKLALHFIMPA